MTLPVRIDSLVGQWNPLDPNGGPWEISVSRHDVAEAIADNRLASVPGGADHAARIAYLVEHPAIEPIGIDIGVPGLGYPGPAWGIVDGNHRVAAAMIRGDDTIRADIDGEVEEIKTRFGITNRQLDDDAAE